jgi:hypothetical protein
MLITLSSLSAVIPMDLPRQTTRRLQRDPKFNFPYSDFAADAGTSVLILPHGCIQKCFLFLAQMPLRCIGDTSSMLAYSASFIPPLLT